MRHATPVGEERGQRAEAERWVDGWRVLGPVQRALELREPIERRARSHNELSRCWQSAVHPRLRGKRRIRRRILQTGLWQSRVADANAGSRARGGAGVARRVTRRRLVDGRAPRLGTRGVLARDARLVVVAQLVEAREGQEHRQFERRVLDVAKPASRHDAPLEAGGGALFALPAHARRGGDRDLVAAAPARRDHQRAHGGDGSASGAVARGGERDGIPESSAVPDRHAALGDLVARDVCCETERDLGRAKARPQRAHGGNGCAANHQTTPHPPRHGQILARPHQWRRAEAG